MFQYHTFAEYRSSRCDNIYMRICVVYIRQKTLCIFIYTFVYLTKFDESIKNNGEVQKKENTNPGNIKNYFKMIGVK